MTSKTTAASPSGRRTHLSMVPDSGLIDLFDSLDAVGEMLTVKRPT